MNKDVLSSFTFQEKDGYGMYPKSISKMSEKGSDIQANLKINFPTTGIYTNLTEESNWSDSGFIITEGIRPFRGIRF